MKRWRWLILLGMAVFPPVAGTARAGVLAPELQAIAGGVPSRELIPVIITFVDKVDPAALAGRRAKVPRDALVRALRSKANVTQAPLRILLESSGAQSLVQLWLINGVAVQVPAGMLRALASWPGVEGVRLDYGIPAPVTTAAPAAVPEWNLSAIRAPDLWALGFTGAGVIIASMDTGVDASHPDLNAKWRGGANSWFDPYGVHPVPFDRNGHGTQTMGIMLGGDAGGTAIGVAPGARWIAAKIFNDANVAKISAIHTVFQWMLDPDGVPETDDAPDVVNASWGLGNPGACDAEFQEDLRVLKAAGIFVALAAGNDGPHALTGVSPANNPAGFAIGAVDAGNTVAAFSSRGHSACDGTIFPELVAPGVAVRTADLSLDGMANYAMVSGTSFASPHVAGAAALLLGALPSKSVLELELAMKLSATDLGVALPDQAYGYGMLDVQAAYQYLANADGCSQSSPDEDADGIPDACDNCARIANADQRDSNGDGYGNLCDGDFNNDGSTNLGDLTILRHGLGLSVPDIDLDGNGVVNLGDVTLFRATMGRQPGPSGLVQ